MVSKTVLYHSDTHRNASFFLYFIMMVTLSCTIRNLSAILGDTFTPRELLPVTQKLIEKVDNPGRGKGIVSGAKSPEDLADKLFTNFFMIDRRIVKLDEKDISGLDALQALALSGQVSSLRNHDNIPVTEAYATNTISFRAVKLAKKLMPNRHVVINPARKHNSAGKRRNGTIPVKPETGGGNQTKGDQKYCHWSYHCTNPSNLDTCRLKTDCGKDTPVVECKFFCFNSNRS
ncbi:hypothetical protein ABMA27_013395 [Loxostege sticticalis]|uniref:Uncharacterized protein n=1 Tax=Loxostege sticticalis TaxID=481309 RepID=A0ABR3IF44_LOXSC